MTDRELMQMALDALESRELHDRFDAIKALSDRLAQPEPEPVNLEPYLERLVDLCNNSTFYCGAEEVIAAEAALERLYKSRKAVPPKIEPDDLTAAYMSGLHDGKKKREWVGLSKSEFEEAVSDHEDLMDICVAIEEKLKEKNT